MDPVSRRFVVTVQDRERHSREEVAVFGVAAIAETQVETRPDLFDDVGSLLC